MEPKRFKDSMGSGDSGSLNACSDSELKPRKKRQGKASKQNNFEKFKARRNQQVADEYMLNTMLKYGLVVEVEPGRYADHYSLPSEFTYSGPSEQNFETFDQTEMLQYMDDMRPASPVPGSSSDVAVPEKVVPDKEIQLSIALDVTADEEKLSVQVQQQAIYQAEYLCSESSDHFTMVAQSGQTVVVPLNILKEFNTKKFMGQTVVVPQYSMEVVSDKCWTCFEVKSVNSNGPCCHCKNKYRFCSEKIGLDVISEKVHSEIDGHWYELVEHGNELIRSTRLDAMYRRTPWVKPPHIVNLEFRSADGRVLKTRHKVTGPIAAYIHYTCACVYLKIRNRSYIPSKIFYDG